MPLRSQSRRGFSLLEIITVVVIAAILASMATVTFVAVTNRSKDRAALVSLSAFARQVQATTALRTSDRISDADFADAADDLTGVANGTGVLASGRPEVVREVVAERGARIVVSYALGVKNPASNTYDLTSAAVGDAAGVAALSASGACIGIRLTVSTITEVAMPAPREQCTGQSALSGNGIAGNPAPSTAPSSPTLTRPAVPTGAQASAVGSDAAVTWNAVTGATSYRVYRNGAVIHEVTGAQFTDTGLTPGTPYSYELTAVNAAGESSHTAPIVVVSYIAPTTPTGLTATPGGDSVTARWDSVAATAAAPVTGYRVYIDGVQQWSGTATTATVDGLAGGVSVAVTVAAYGSGGVSAQSAPVSATPYAAPGIPQNVTVTAGDTAAALTWGAPANDPSMPVTGYEVFRDGVSVWSGTTTSWTDTGLTNGTSYSFTVRTVGSGGNSDLSAPVTATPITVPATPGGLAAAAGDAQAALSWAPVPSTAAAPVTGYRVYQDGVQVWSGAPAAATITGLINGTSYNFTVQATGPGGVSTQSASVAMTPVGIPAVPAGLVATAGDTQVTLNWTAVTSTPAAPVTGYEIFRDGVSVWTGTATTWTNTGLTNGTSYSFTVRSTSTSGNSAQSDPVTVTPVTAPATPGNVTVTPGDTQATVSWTPVPVTGAAPVTGYRVYQGGVQVWSGTATSATVTGLTNGTTYSFTVQSTGPGGVSAQTAPAVTATPAGTAAGPAGFTATAGDTQVALSWNPVTSTVAAPVTGYEVFRDGVSVWTGTATTWTNTGLANGTSYSFTVRTLGSAGNSPQTAPVTITPITAPASPGNVTATPGDAQVTVQWDATISTAAAPVTGYRVYQSGVQVWSGTSTSATISGLTNGVSYSFTVVAYGAGGSSPQSLTVTTTPITAPATPAGFTGTAGDTTDTLTWTAATTPASAPVTGYEVLRNAVSVTTVSGATSTTWTDTGLVNGTTYTYVIRSTGPGGTSAPSAPVTLTPVTAPAAPTGVAATAGNNQVTVSWSAAASTAAAPVSGYRVYQGGVQVWSGTATSATVTGLTNGTTYSFTVQSTGPGGVSAQTAPAVTATPVNPPATPTGLVGTASAGAAQLSWTAVTPTSAAPVSGYEIFRDGVSVWTGTATTWTNTGLTNGTTYSYTVRTLGPGGNSAQSAPVTATPVTAPAVPTGLAAIPGNAQVALSWTAVANTAAAPVSGYRVYQGGVQVWSGAAATATVTGLANGTSYSFTVTTYGSGGESAQSATVSSTPVTAPAVPTGLTVTPGNTQAVLSWTAVTSTAAAPVSGYEVFRGGVSVWTGTAITWTNTGLTNGTSYAYTVRTLGPGGNSQQSVPVSVTPVTTPAVPTGLSAAPSNTQVQLTWNQVASTAAAPVSGYRIYQGGVQIAQTTLLTYTVTGLTNGTSYTFTVTAYGTGGESSQSAGVPATPVTAVNPPTGFTAAAGNAQVQLTWTAVTSTAAAPVSGYEIFRGGVSVWSGTATTWTNTGLTNGTTYSYTVRTLGPGGNSAQTAAANATPVTAPATPTGLAPSAGNTQVTLSWNAVANTAAAPVSGYRVYQGGVQVWSGTTTTTTITGLTNGTSYTFTVTAYGNGGESAQSAGVSATPATVPSVPRSPSASAGDSYVMVLWTVPSSTGGASIDTYRITTSPGGAQTTLTAAQYTANGNGGLVNGLTNGTSYTFTVAAHNTAGWSSESVATGAVTPAGVPATPTGLTAAPGNGQVQVSWNAVTGTATAPVTGYRVYRSGLQIWSGAGTTIMNAGLTNGTSYTWTVTAYGSGGESAQSAGVSATPVQPPATPTGLTAAAGPNKIELTWNAVTGTTVAPVTGYKIFQNGGATPVWTGAATTTIISGLTNGTSYSFTVAAYNSGGDSTVSAAVSATPITYASTVSNSAPTDWWKLNESAGATSTGVRFDGFANASLSTPDTAGVRTAGSIDVRIRVQMNDWTPDYANILASKWDSTSVTTNREWTLTLNTDGTLSFAWMESNNSTGWSAKSTVALAFANNADMWVRAVMSSTTGAVSFYTCPSTCGTYSQLGTTVATKGAATTIQNGTAGLAIGSSNAGTQGTLENGTVKQFQLYASTTGASQLVNLDPTGRPINTLTMADSQGHTWTMSKGAYLSSATVAANAVTPGRPMHYFSSNSGAAAGPFGGTASAQSLGNYSGVYANDDDAFSPLATGVNGFTLEMWVNPAVMGQGGPTMGTLAGKGSATVTAGGAAQSSYEWALRVGPSNGVLQFVTWDGGGAQTNRTCNATTAKVLPNQWNHVVVQWGGSSGMVQMWANGVSNVCDWFTTFSPNADGVLSVATRGGDDGHFFWAQYDEVAFYNKVVSSAEVLAHYNAGRLS